MIAAPSYSSAIEYHQGIHSAGAHFPKNFMHHSCNCNHPSPDRYQYKGYWIHIYLAADFEHERILYFATVELTNEQGCIESNAKESREESEFAAEEMIDSWN